VLTVGAERGIIRTQHGLDLIPRYDLASLPKLDRMLVPGRPEAAMAAPADDWAAAHRITAEHTHASGAICTT
jgi:hypothetical protein